MKLILSAAVSIALAAAAPQGAPVAVIVNSGSTNAPGFRIVVQKSGDAEYTATPPKAALRRNEASAKPMRRKIADALVQRLYADLEAAKPLGALPKEGCMKSASFGTKLTIEFGAEETPDLSCDSSQNERTQGLTRDANEIVKLFRAN